MKSLLIATGSAVLAQTLSQEMSQCFDITVCQDGHQALQLLCDMRPDAAVLDLMLPQMDGVSVLRVARDAGVQSTVIAVSAYISDYVMNILECLQVRMVLRLPCDTQFLVRSIVDAANWTPEENDSRRSIREILVILGFKLNTRGTAVVEEAIRQYIASPNCAIVDELYPAVARACDGSACQVERAIRSSIDSAWKHADERIWRLYFATGKNGRVTRPSNAVFLAGIARCVREENANEPYQQAL